MSIPLGTFGTREQRVTDDWRSPWLQNGETPLAWLESNFKRFICSPSHIVRESEQYCGNGIPCLAGIYFLIADNEILYVGISNNLDRRLYQHWENDVQFSRVFCFGGIPDNFLTEVECFYIHALDPPLNIKIPPKGEVAGEYLKRLRKGTLSYTYV